MKEGLPNSHQDLIKNETFVAKEFANLITGRPGFIFMVAPMYMATIVNPARARVFRYLYLSARHIDDLVDGDKKVIGDPIDYLRRYQKVISQRKKIDPLDPYENIILRGLGEAAQLTTEQDDVYRDFFRLTDAIFFDHQRSLEGRLLSEENLNEYYREIFEPSLNISLICAGSEFRAADFPEMIYGQGRLYSVRDLQKDWERRLYNIPLKTLYQAGIDQSVKFKVIETNPVIQTWIENELAEGGTQARNLRDKLKSSDLGAKLICTIPLIGMERIAKPK